jgi:AraC-like DNA-binding protein
MSLPSARIAHFHVVDEGSCWLSVDGEPESIVLAAGDLVVLPHGGGHQIADAPGAPTTPLASLLSDGEPGACRRLRYGGGGARTTLICGAFTFQGDTGHPLLARLPAVPHLPRATDHAAWLEPLLRVLAAETAAPRPGSETVINRVVDIVFVQALRAWLDTAGDADAGWLGALRDPQIGSALQRLHEAPDESWTVASLAAEVGLSRSSLAARFAALVGEPPVAYLARWRLSLAARALEAENRSLAQIARRVGYASEVAFSRAFRRHFGVAPGTYRRQARLSRGTERSA